MFDEDFSSLFSLSNRNSGDKFEIVSSHDEITTQLLSNVKTRYGPHPIDETVLEFVEEIARSLIWCGRAFYFFQEDTEQNERYDCANFWYPCSVGSQAHGNTF